MDDHEDDGCDGVSGGGDCEKVKVCGFNDISVERRYGAI